MTLNATLALLQAVAVMTLLGFFIVDLLLPRKAFSSWFVWALAWPVGAGICSLIVFVFRRPMFTVERLLLLVLFGVWLWKRRSPLPSFSQIAAWRMPVLHALFGGVIIVALTSSIERTSHIPHGATDGWAIWNSHARYIYRDGNEWQQYIHHTYHADYPLLLPLNVVRFWRYAGDEVQDMAAVLGVLFGFAGIAVLGAALSELRGSSTGMLMALTLLTTSFYTIQATYQEADVPLSLFFLSVIALLYVYFEREPANRGLLILAGFLAGCAASTKNEGLLFLVATGIVLSVPVLWNARATVQRIALFSAGLLLPMLVLIYFKVTIAPVNDLAEGRQYSEVMDKILTLDRHLITFRNILETAWSFGRWSVHPIFLLFAFLVWRGVHRPAVRSHGWRAGVAILAIVLAGYYWIYIVTPIPLLDHLDGSLTRLLLHLWPSVLLMTGFAAKKEDERLQTS